MGLLEWLERRLAPGGIARWAHKLHADLRAQIPQQTVANEEAIPAMMLTLRYGLASPNPANERERELVEANLAKVRNIFDVCHCVAFVELCDNIVSTIHQMQMYHHYTSLLNDELTRLGHQPPNKDYRYKMELR